MNMHQQPGIRIKRLIIHETGTYNTQYRRPYVTELQGHTLDMMSEQLQGANKFVPSAMAGIANSFITPQAQPEKDIMIPQGWGERRMRFMMEIEHQYVTGSVVTEIILGYTNGVGISLQGAVAPDMEFYVNSTMQVRNTITQTPMGNQTLTNVIDSSHVLADNNWGSIYSPEKDIAMRPQDVYATMSRAGLGEMGSVVDLRSTVTNVALKSRRANNMAGNYMASILENYSNASKTQELGNGHQDILAAARGYAQESIATKDPFLSAIAGIRGQNVGNVFTFRELQMLDPYVDHVTQAAFMAEPQRALTHSTGQTMDWGGADRNTNIATILSHAVPSLMMDLMLTRIVFKTSNRFIGGEVKTAFIDAQGFTTVDLTPYLQTFQIRLEHEILKDLSYGNAVDFAIEMQVDLLGETWIKISFDNGPYLDYVTPSFCDALITPILTTNQELSMTLATDFDNLFSHLHDNIVPGQPGNTINVFGGI